MSFIRFLIATALVAAVAFGASPSLGLAVANGSFQLDKSSVYGNASLFDGSLIETAAASSDLALLNGARLRLGTESQARIHADRLVLDKGQTEIAASSGYSIEALGLRVAPDSPQSRVVVAYNGPARIQVAALLGSARISAANGVLLANVPAGTALQLEPQAAGATPPSKFEGRVESKDGAFLLTDQLSHVTYTLAGTDPAPYLHKCVEVTGNVEAAAAGSTQVLRAIAIQETSCAKRGAGYRNKLIIAGVAVAAVGATAGVLSTRGAAKSTISAP